MSAGYFRTHSGEEVDLVLERDDGRVFAFEFKAGSRIHADDVGGIRSLRARIPDRLALAVVFYTGSLAYAYEDGTLVLPLDVLWT